MVLWFYIRDFSTWSITYYLSHICNYAFNLVINMFFISVIWHQGSAWGLLGNYPLVDISRENKALPYFLNLMPFLYLYCTGTVGAVFPWFPDMHLLFVICVKSAQEFCSVGDDSCLILWDARVGSSPVVKVAILPLLTISLLCHGKLWYNTKDFLSMNYWHVKSKYSSDYSNRNFIYFLILIVLGILSHCLQCSLLCKFCVVELKILLPSLLMALH